MSAPARVLNWPVQVGIALQHLERQGCENRRSQRNYNPAEHAHHEPPTMSTESTAAAAAAATIFDPCDDPTKATLTVEQARDHWPPTPYGRACHKTIYNNAMVGAKLSDGSRLRLPVLATAFGFRIAPESIKGYFRAITLDRLQRTGKAPTAAVEQTA
jgi:hypothetical protein